MVEEMKTLVTGSTGFIGSHLVEGLLRQGHQVSCLVRKTSRLGLIERLDVSIVSADHRDPDSLANVVKGMDYVFHCAAAIRALDWETYYQANVLYTKNLIEACAAEARDLKKFVFVSSISATGPSPKRKALDEGSACRPVSDYGRSKLLAEEALAPFQNLIPIVILRFPNVIGPRQNELHQAVKLMAKRILPVIGNGDVQTSLCSVDDAVRALIMAADKKEASGQVYFVTDSRAYRWSEISDAVAECLGVRFFLLKVPFWFQYILAGISEVAARVSGGVPLLTRGGVSAARRHYWLYDGSKFREEIGFEAEDGLKDAVGKAVRWYRTRKEPTDDVTHGRKRNPG